ncbi:MAG: sterol desaturase family protein [Bacteroidota bacterium]|nr:sterol desaturase family protein [Bacteroidota bacterium]MDP4218066.1 sterol desaturase family protein [Bacteroidota bacterium]MDP4247887.1 sterol desaturase family protein [Bacteroidota bacterium]MDP4253608.1 sterol desaturase family protein [Bacteroidota bacterium]MDP4258290.1 sterol desaturase family protein [Bacteroidota bacterium]
MKFDKIHNKGQAQLFKNHYLEMLTKTHPLVIWGIYLPLIVCSLYYSGIHLKFSLMEIAGVFLAGGLFWTFFEYLMHRFVFHWVGESERAQKFVYVMHGNHHHFPRDKERLFMPPVPSIIISSLLFLLMHLVMGGYAFMFFPGFMLGYLMYGTMHFAIHAWNPPFRWMKPLWRNHHLHHYKDDHRGFGVSSTIWDRVFGTMFDLKKEKEDKEKVKELMF